MIKQDVLRSNKRIIVVVDATLPLTVIFSNWFGRELLWVAMLGLDDIRAPIVNILRSFTDLVSIDLYSIQISR